MSVSALFMGRITRSMSLQADSRRPDRKPAAALLLLLLTPAFGAAAAAAGPAGLLLRAAAAAGGVGVGVAAVPGRGLLDAAPACGGGCSTDVMPWAMACMQTQVISKAAEAASTHYSTHYIQQQSKPALSKQAGWDDDAL